MLQNPHSHSHPVWGTWSVQHACTAMTTTLYSIHSMYEAFANQRVAQWSRWNPYLWWRAQELSIPVVPVVGLNLAVSR